MSRISLIVAALTLPLAVVGQVRADLFGVTDTIVDYTVPTTGNYVITVDGAQGGNAYGGSGGLGAVVTGTVTLTAGVQLEIVVGAQGQSGGPGNYVGGGGGGGSFVYVVGESQPLAVAGGGGGAGYYDTNGLAASTDTSGAGVNGGGYYYGAGGTGGLGGNGGSSVYGLSNGGGGGGWSGNGGSGSGSSSGFGGQGATSSTSFLGGVGGYNDNGGFGGGGGGGDNSGGGGGGYSGGGGGDGNGDYAGGGGGSYLAGLLNTSAAVTNTGDGSVSITFSPAISSATPEPSTCLLAAMGALGLMGYAWRRRKSAAV